MSASSAAQPERAAGLPKWGPVDPPFNYAGPQPLDPYLRWAVATDFLGYTNLREFSGREPEHNWMSFVAKARNLKGFEQFVNANVFSPQAKSPWIFVPPIYLQALRNGSARSLIFTGRVHRADLQRLVTCDEIESFELGLPVSFPGSVAGGAFALDEDKEAEAPPALKFESVIGIIDYGGPFLHPGFLTRDRAGSRFCAVWDQGIKARLPWRRLSDLGYGRELDRSAINDWRLFCRTDFAGDELATYAALGYTLDRDDAKGNRVLRDTHGAHVADMLAGTIDPLAAVRKSRGVPVPDRDAASDAPLVFVQIPLPTLVDSSGGSLNVHILDGIRYIIARAKEAAHIVINISYGQHGGPHDGSSMLEQAMDEIVLASGRRVVLVIGAGNERNANAHAEIQLTDESPQTVQWYVPGKDTTDSFLELWYPRTINGADAALSLEVRPPDGEWSPAVKADGPAVLLRDADGKPLAQLVHSARVPNGQDAMALLALAPTQRDPATTRPAAPTGTWEIRLSTKCDAGPVTVHAWIEREDLPDTLARSEFRSHVGEACTVNGIATGEHCIVVGACRSSDGSNLPYSGLGPTRAAGRIAAVPTVRAECDESDALEGIRAGTMRAGDTLRMGGTSVAAPVAAREAYNLLMEGATPSAPRRRDAKAPLDVTQDHFRNLPEGRLRPTR